LKSRGDKSINNNPKCPFRNSENTELITNQDHLVFKYKKVENDGTTTTGNRFTRFMKSFCLDCGMVFEYMDDKTLSRYKEDKPYLY
jgi:hypothetical protein